MVGTGRGTELHINGYKRVFGVDLRCKQIMCRTQAKAEEAKAKYGFELCTISFENLLSDPEINLIDICTPPYTHADMVIKALEAGKNVICEKPLTGCFNSSMTKVQMFHETKMELERLEKIIRQSEKHFMYAENFVYAPQIQRAKDILISKQNRILFIKGEESLKGSSSPVAGEWCKTGGGTLMRVGSHPLGAAIYLKQIEAKARGIDIRPESVICDCTRITSTLTPYEHRAIAAQPHDVEDMCTLVIAFSDGSRCTIIANDTLLGGSRNYVELYCNDAVINCKVTLSDLLETYFPDDENLGNISLSEMLPVKTGWNKAFVADEVLRGYVAEIQDFCESVAYDRDPIANFQLAKEVTLIMYAAYASAETGKRVFL